MTPIRWRVRGCGLMAAVLAALLVGLDDTHAQDTSAAAAPETWELDDSWALQSPRMPRIPDVQRAEWPVSEIDRFILSRLESAELSPAADADPQTLLRRVHFDLTGLPPNPAVRTAFLADVDRAGLSTAYETLVDRLLAQPQFGETWARRWLDVARYAESSGQEANISFPYAWRYRDYVIDCFQADKPFDRFLTEQLAGDLLPAETPPERARLLIATGFLALGPKNLDQMNARQFEADVIDEQIDAVTRAVMAHSVACARCHDHTFDPYTMEDYYALAGVFASTRTYFGTFVSPANRVGGDPLVLPLEAEQPVFHKAIPAKRVTQLKAELEQLQAESRAGQAAVMKAVLSGQDPAGIFTLRDALRIFWRSGAIEGQLEKVDDQGQPLPLAMGVLDEPRVTEAPLLERGDVSQPGEPVARRFPLAITLPDAPQFPADQSGRLELAKWLTHPQHPLTSRVIVNRVWHHLFGTGIVRTVDNFGTTGERPSHPELLDFLAIRFVQQGWSIRTLVRQIVLSRTYRQASHYNAQAFEIDPDNRLLWRASKRRLEAEAIRDAMLAATGELQLDRPAGSLVGRVIGDRPISLIGLDRRIPSDLDQSLHRSVYLPILRNRLPDVLDLFDCAEPSLVTGARERTNVPLQALYLLNSRFVTARSQAFATRIASLETQPAARIRLAYQLCFGREPDADELSWGLGFLRDEPPTAASSQHTTRSKLADYCQALFATAEFRNLD